MSENTKTDVGQGQNTDEPIIREQIMNQLWDDALTAHVINGDDRLMQALFRALHDMGVSSDEIDRKAEWYAAEFIKRAMA
jgi:hypothetical protein